MNQADMAHYKEDLKTFLQKLSSDMGNDEQINQYDFYNYRSYFLNDNLLKMLCLTKYDEDMYGHREANQS